MAPSTDARTVEQLARIVGLAAALRNAVAFEARQTTKGEQPPPCCHRGCATCTRSKEEE
jgi:hypothetical protein